MCPSRPSGSDTVERKEVQDKISGEEAAEELVETKKVVEDLEREDQDQDKKSLPTKVLITTLGLGSVARLP